jgi:small multidrug resistance pump
LERIWKQRVRVFINTLHHQSYTVVNFLQSFTPTLNQAWALLSVAIVFEVAGTTSMKLSHGFTHLTPSILMFACYAAAFSCNALVVKTLDLSITYAVWSGVGTVATAAIGIFWFREPATALKLVCISFIVMGVFGLHAASRLQTHA